MFRLNSYCDNKPLSINWVNVCIADVCISMILSPFFDNSRHAPITKLLEEIEQKERNERVYHMELIAGDIAALSNQIQEYKEKYEKLPNERNPEVQQMCKKHNKLVSYFIFLELEKSADYEEEIGTKGNRFFFVLDKKLNEIQLDKDNFMVYVNYSNNVILLEKYINPSNVTQKTIYGNVLDQQSCFSNNEAVILKLLDLYKVECIRNSNCDILCSLVSKNYFDALLYLKEKYVIDFNHVYNEGKTRVRPLISYAILNNNVTATEFLLKHNADPNLANEKGTTPLFWCAISDNVEIAQKLKEYGAMMEYKNKKGQTAVERAEECGSRNFVKEFRNPVNTRRYAPRGTRGSTRGESGNSMSPWAKARQNKQT